MLSAGPLEQLLGNHGPEFIEVVQQQAIDDPAFARLLGGLYRFRMSDDIWGRVTAISNKLMKQSRTALPQDPRKSVFSAITPFSAVPACRSCRQRRFH